MRAATAPANAVNTEPVESQAAVCREIRSPSSVIASAPARGARRHSQAPKIIL